MVVIVNWRHTEGWNQSTYIVRPVRECVAYKCICEKQCYEKKTTQKQTNKKTKHNKTRVNHIILIGKSTFKQETAQWQFIFPTAVSDCSSRAPLPGVNGACPECQLPMRHRNKITVKS